MKRKPISNRIRVIHNAPGKQGKQEYREFDTIEKAMAYIERNAGRCHLAPGNIHELQTSIAANLDPAKSDNAVSIAIAKYRRALDRLGRE